MAAKVFYLVRIEDPSGVAGTGIVAEGVQWSQGDAHVKWLSDYPCVQWWPKGWHHTNVIHTHGGKTKIVWAEDGPPPDSPGVDINQTIAPDTPVPEVDESG
jgi:hypothetical protein